MKLIPQSIEPINYLNPLNEIEVAGRVSHKSEDRITTESMIPFFKSMLKIGHTATLEFGNVYLCLEDDNELINESNDEYHDLLYSNFSKCPYCKSVLLNGSVYVYTNLRFLLDTYPVIFQDYINNSLPNGVTYYNPKQDDPYRRYCFKIVCNRGISHELVRHRAFSFLQESTRYVKYDGTMQIIIPHWMTDMDIPIIIYGDIDKLEIMDGDSIQWHEVVSKLERTYKTLITDCQLKPQDASGILPNDLKTELFMSGYLKDWIGHNKTTSIVHILGEDIEVKSIKGFDTLRRDSSAHPQAREIANMIFEYLYSQVGSTTFNEMKETYYE